MKTLIQNETFVSFVVHSTRPPRVTTHPLTDDVINEIAVNRLTHKISALGLAMDFPLAKISKYETENDREPRVESRGTKNMIQHWREKCTASDQIGAFCAVLRKAELRELEGDLSAGMHAFYQISLKLPLLYGEIMLCIQ